MKRAESKKSKYSSWSDSPARQANLSKKREQILDGALRTFLEFGYAGTSMDKVSYEAGVSKQTIYSHFSDKQGLFSALAHKLTQETFPVENLPDLEKLAPAIYLKKVANQFLERMDHWEYTAFYRLVISESGRFPELAQNYTENVINPGTESLIKYFKSNSKMKIKDPETSARIFRGALSSYIVSQELLYGKHSNSLSREKFVNRLIEMVLSK